MSNKHPERVFRIGSVSASIFAREIATDHGRRTVRNVVLQRRYVDGEETRYTNGFGLAELSQIAACLEHARRYVETREAEIDLGD